jgi:hypothetical protein
MLYIGKNHTKDNKVQHTLFLFPLLVYSTLTHTHTQSTL